MLDLGSMSFIISTDATRAFSIRLGRRDKHLKPNDISRNNLKTEGLLTLGLAVTCPNHWSHDKEDHAFQVIQTSGDYNASISAWYLEKHKAIGRTTSHLHFPHCPPACYGYGKIPPEYSIPYNR